MDAHERDRRAATDRQGKACTNTLRKDIIDLSQHDGGDQAGGAPGDGSNANKTKSNNSSSIDNININDSRGSQAKDATNSNSQRNSQSNNNDGDGEHRKQQSHSAINAPSSSDAAAKTTRKCLHLNVGAYHQLEVIVHVRRVDWKWFQEGYDSHIEDEMFSLLQEAVLPRMFADELEQYYRWRHPNRFPPSNDFATIHAGRGAPKRRGKGKRKATGANATSASKATKRKAMACDEKPNDKPTKDVYYAFGDSIQLAYRLRPIKKLDRTASLVISRISNASVNVMPGNADDGTNADKRKASRKKRAVGANSSSTTRFMERIKLSQRLLVWCCRVDTVNPINPDPANFGFFRPDMVPMASLFRHLGADNDIDEVDSDSSEEENEFE